MKTKLLLTLIVFVLSMGGAFANHHWHYTKAVATTKGNGKVYVDLASTTEPEYWLKDKDTHPVSTPYWSGTKSGNKSELSVHCHMGTYYHDIVFNAGVRAEPSPGYHFLGWKQKESDTNYFTTDLYFTTGNFKVWTDDNDRYTSPSKAYIAKQYYAYFEANKYSVAFDKNADDATGSHANINATYDQNLILPTNFVRHGYYLKNWNTKADGTGKGFAKGVNVKNITTEKDATATLYANWVENVDPEYEQKVFTFHPNYVYENVITSTNTLNGFTLSIVNPSTADIAEVLPGNKIKINKEGSFDIYVNQPAADEYNQVVDKKVATCITSSYDFLSMKAVGGNVTIGSYIIGNPTYVLQYSLDRATWTDYAVTSEGPIVTIPAGQTCYFRTASPTVQTAVNDVTYKNLSPECGDNWNFTMSGEGTIEAGGNIMSLLDQTCQSLTVGDFCFSWLFEGCTLLTVAPNLPATTLGEYCYESMFDGCTLIQKAPYLPAKQLKRDCYAEMFKDCASLNFVEADFVQNLPYYNNGSALETVSYFKDNTANWLSGTAATGVINLQLDKIIYTDSFYDHFNIPEGWLDAVSVQLEEASENSGVFYSTYGHISGGTKIFDIEPQQGFKAMYVQVADGKVLLSEAPDNVCHGQAMVIYGNSNRTVVTHSNMTQLESDDNILQFGEKTVPANGYILKHGANGFGFYKSEGEEISEYRGYFVYADGPDFMPMYNLSYLTPMWEELDNHVAGVLGSTLSEQVLAFVQSIKTNMNEAPNEDAARAVLVAGIEDFDQRVANHQHSYTKCDEIDDVNHHVYCTNTDGFCADIDHGVEEHEYGNDVEQTAFYTCLHCSHINEIRRRSYGTRNSLSFTAVGGDVTITLSRTGLEQDNNYLLMISSDRQLWSASILEATNTIEIPEGQTLYFCYGGDRIYASNNNTHEKALNLDDNNGWRFSVAGEGTVEAGGNIMSLLDKTATLTSLGSHAFSHLFEGCTKLTKAPELPATALGERCYLYMFKESGITAAPELPSTSIAKAAYERMFNGCRNLAAVPTIPAVYADYRACVDMFNGCENLTGVNMPNLNNISSGGDPFSRWLDNTATGKTGTLSLPLDMIGNNSLHLPANWQWATKLKANEDPTAGQEGNFYTTFYDDRFDYVVDEGSKAYTGEIASGVDGKELHFTATPNNIIAKGDGVLIHSGSNEVQLTVSNASATQIEGNVLTGSNTDITAPADCYILSYGQNGLGFYKYAEGKTLSAHKAYLISSAVAGANLRMVFMEDELTGIENINDDDTLRYDNDNIYNLQGVRMNKLHKGINIVNGRKIIVK